MGDAKTYNGDIVRKGDYVCVHGNMLEVKWVYPSGTITLVNNYGEKFSIHSSLVFSSIKDYLRHKLDIALTVVNNTKYALDNAKLEYKKALKEYSGLWRKTRNLTKRRW